jgi:S1-C subfamily serine protease
MWKETAVALAITLTLCMPAWAQESVTNSIVKIYTTHNRPSYSRPWQMLGQRSGTGSGCVIEGNRILTNAHVVSDHTFIRVRRAGKADKYVARVAAVSHELDLAILKVAESDFFVGAKPLEVGELPHVGEKVVAYGFPRGGTRITITEGVVSRIDRRRYVHSGFSNLVCQIDAAINPGSSGGPIISGGKIVGVSFQSTSGQNIGYMVPAPLIKHFYKDLKDGSHNGVPGLPFVWQNMENPQLRSHHRMKASQSGILITKVAPRYLGDKLLRPGDILLTLDGYDVANDGTIAFRKNERINFRYAIDRKQVRDQLKIQLFRDGGTLTCDIPLQTSKVSYGYLIPRPLYETPPTYLIVGGLVFSPLTANYLKIWKKWSKAPSRLKKYYKEMVTTENQDRKDVVVLIDVLPDQLNVGYVGFEDYVVSHVNGKKISGMKELLQAIEGHKGDHHRFTMEPYGSEIVFSRKELAERGRIILDKYKVPMDRSTDLGKSHEGKKSGSPGVPSSPTGS